MYKKVLAVMLVVLALAGAASAEVAGHLTMAGNDFPEETLTSGLQPEHHVPRSLSIAGVDISKTEFKYYDSLSTMLLALDRGDIDYIDLPRDVARYVLENNRDLTLKGVSWYTIEAADTLNFAFLEKKSELLKKFNDALADMNKDGTLAILEKAYVNNYGLNEQPSVKFTEFEDAETITVAVTGDLPPIDYVAEDGTPAGFNVAVLAEIARRLHVNIKTIQVETGARVAALTSERVDAAFWFRENLGVGKFPSSQFIMLERPKGVIISEPYYAWNEFYFLGRK